MLLKIAFGVRPYSHTLANVSKKCFQERMSLKNILIVLLHHSIDGTMIIQALRLYEIQWKTMIFQEKYYLQNREEKLPQNEYKEISLIRTLGNVPRKRFHILLKPRNHFFVSR